MSNPVTFGEIVKNRRSRLGLTQVELANRASCAAITIRKIESNKLKPSVQLAQILADILGVDDGDKTGFIQLARQDQDDPLIPAVAPKAAEIGLSDLSGRAIKGFNLSERIGSGGFGVVYKAMQISVNREVAVKIIRPQYANHPTFIRRFESEAYLIARLEHPHVVPLYDYWREPDAAYLIMRLLRGGNLEDLLKNGPLNQPQFRSYASQIGTALALAHDHGVIHRDVKPGNILLDESQNSYLADFGIAKNLWPIDEQSELTDENALIGSPAYIAPEQIQNQQIGPHTDMYSFGLLLYEMATGEKAFPGPTPAAYLNQHLNLTPDSIRDQNDNFPPELDQIISRATAKNPEDRFSSMRELLTSFDHVWQATSNVLFALENGQTVRIPADVTNIENPYQGLQPFTEANADHFFGRDRFVDELLSMLNDGRDLSRFAAVIGPSGSGKSSLVKAGFLPAIRQGRLPLSDKWFVVDITPGAHPWEELEIGLLRVAVNPPESLLSQLQSDERGLLRAVGRVLPKDEEIELLLIIDQFEELFTLVRDEETRDAFLNSLVTGVLDPKSRLRVVITLRADFVDRPLYYVDFGEMIKQRLMLLLPLSPDEMSSAIRYPLIESGMDAEPELVATLVREMGDQPGLLPLLQYTLTELFETRTGSTLTLDAYRNIGGVAGSLSQRADEIYQDLTESQRELTRELFLRLVTLGEGNEDTRKRTKLAELNQLNLTGQDRGDLEQIIDAFGTFRLLTFDHDPITRQQTVEVAHEALLREWPRLRHWLSNSREDVRRQRELADAASAWYKNGEEDSYLLRGSRLASVEAWKDQSSVRLTREETRFLEASLESRDKVEKEEAERRERELQTAQQLAEAERGRAEEQAVSNMRLRRRALGLVGALLVAMILAGVAFRFAQTSNQNADEAAQQRDIAQQSEADALEAYSQALAANARQVLETDDQELALLLALAATNVENPSEAAWQTLLDIAYAPGLAEQIEVGDGAESMAISHSNQFILVGNQNGTVDVIDLDTQQVITSLIGHQGPVFTIRLSADDQFALSGSADNTAIFWDLERGEVVQQLVGHSDDVTAVDFLNGTAQAITGEFSRSAPGTLITWDLATGEALSRFGDDVETGNEQGISSLKATSDGKMALVGLQQSAASLQRQLNVWDIENQTLLHSLQLKELEFEVILINDVDISPNDQLGAAAADNGSIYIIDLHSGEITKRFDSHIGAVNSIRFSEDGFSIISAGSDGRIEWRLVDSGDILQTHQTASNAVSEALFWGESKAISLDHVGYVQMWDLTNQWRQGEWGTGVLSNDENVNELTFSPNGELVALTVFENDGRAGHRLILIDYETESVVWEHEFDVGLDSMSVLQFTPDGERLLTSPGDDTIAVWEVKTGQELNRLIGHKSTIRSVDISDDGKRAISTGLDNMVILWDIESGQPVRIMLGHLIGHGTTSVRFLKGDEFAASTAFDSSIIIWDLETGTQIKRLTGINSSIGNHLDGFGIFEIRQMQHNGMLLSVGRDQSIIMWDVVSGEPVKEFLGHGDLVRFMDVIGDGRTFLSSSTNNRLILWEVDGVNPKREFTPIGRSDSFAPMIALHPDGDRVLIDEPPSGKLAELHIAEPEPEALIDWIRENRALRELTCQERLTYQIEPLCVEDSPQESTTDLIDAVGEKLNNRERLVVESPAIVAADNPLQLDLPQRVTFVAEVGENRGELSPQGFDTWLYEGRADEIISLEMIADSPADDDTIPLSDRNQAGVLDTNFIIRHPDGTILSRALEGRTSDFQISPNGRIEALVLPDNGTYQIEARSFLDEGEGAYTLRIEKIPEIKLDPDFLSAVEGRYFEGPWTFKIDIDVVDDQLYYNIAETAESLAMIPIDDTYFTDSIGVIYKFNFDENGTVTGYDFWLPPIYPPGGQWYEGVRVTDE